MLIMKKKVSVKQFGLFWSKYFGGFIYFLRGNNLRSEQFTYAVSVPSALTEFW